MKKASFMLLFPLLFQIIFFGSGLYGVVLEGEALLCECNHSTENEVHQSHEDIRFRRNSHLKMAMNEDETMKESCHSAKKGEAHLCKCKKANKQSEFLQTFVNTIYLKSQKNCIYPELLNCYILKGKESYLFPGHFNQQIKPPNP